MFLTVTLHAAVDKAWCLPALEPGQLHRLTAHVTLAGGKGINVSRVLRAIGAEALATGMGAGPTGKAISSACCRVPPGWCSLAACRRACRTRSARG